MKKTKLDEMLVEFAAIYRQKLSQYALDIYVEALAEYNIDEISKAIEELAKTCKFFPVPAEFIEKLAGEPARALLGHEKLEAAGLRKTLNRTISVREYLNHREDLVAEAAKLPKRREMTAQEYDAWIIAEYAKMEGQK